MAARVPACAGCRTAAGMAKEEVGVGGRLGEGRVLAPGVEQDASLLWPSLPSLSRSELNRSWAAGRELLGLCTEQGREAASQQRLATEAQVCDWLGPVSRGVRG